jgi:esterase/lipase superfamily enzyme/acyl carrier protein
MSVGIAHSAWSQTTASSVEEILTEIAQYVGIDRGEIDPDDDLVEDLFLDRAEAFQLFAVLCDRHGIPLPSGDGITRVGEIASYLSGAVASRGTFVRNENPQRIVNVFYATDRARTGSEDPAQFYDGNRSANGDVEYGTVEVIIPGSHRPGQLETPFFGLRILNSPQRHVTVTNVSPMSAMRFWSRVADDLASMEGDTRSDIVLFVHGYRVTFEGAARRTAQIAVDMAESDAGFQFAPIFYSWPSNGTLSGYMSDREDVTWSAGHIEDFLLDTFERSNNARIHLVAHSMGSQGLLGALRLLARNPRSGGGALFENVLLAAPDFDADVFEQQMAKDEILRLSRQWTVYTSDRDAALKASSVFNEARRLGLPIIALPGVDMIDATGLEVTPWNVPEFHSYFATKQRVINDVASVLSGVRPTARRLLRETLGDRIYWRLINPEGDPSR